MNTELEVSSNTPAKGRLRPFGHVLTDKVATTATARNVYGDPVEKDGVTVIPVAKVGWMAVGSDTEQGASRGGGGVNVKPVGYVEIKGGRARFRPIFDPSLIIQMIFGGGIVAAIVLDGVRKIIRTVREN